MINNTFKLDNNKYYELSNFKFDNNYSFEFLEVNETISQLAYLTHDYFRYYGKFPSKVGKTIIQDLLSRNLINPANDFIFDNYAGSGTSLVEAKIAEFDSIGIDINPFAVLASRVKTYCLNETILNEKWNELSSIIYSYVNYYKNKHENTNSFATEINENLLFKIEHILKNIYIEFKDISKWFNEDAIKNLAIIKTIILEMPFDRYREFFSLGFFAIIRRVSYAYDGEVRPHVNKTKKNRDVLQTYNKKINEMIQTMKEWNIVTDNQIYSNAFLCSNIDKNNINELLSNERKKINKELGLVISHPPYLNCFDYIPVYKLKFLWAYGFEEIYGSMDYKTIKKNEIKSYPANNDKLINNYFENNKKAYEIMYQNLKENGYCCIVIGDCTVRKQMFRVHKIFIKMLEDIGFNVEKIVYRSTHYGLGKYAYNFRADYHDNDEAKKDAIIFFRK